MSLPHTSSSSSSVSILLPWAQNFCLPRRNSDKFSSPPQVSSHFWNSISYHNEASLIRIITIGITERCLSSCSINPSGAKAIGKNPPLGGDSRSVQFPATLETNPAKECFLQCRGCACAHHRAAADSKNGYASFKACLDGVLTIYCSVTWTKVLDLLGIQFR